MNRREFVTACLRVPLLAGSAAASIVLATREREPGDRPPEPCGAAVGNCATCPASAGCRRRIETRSVQTMEPCRE